MTFLREKDDLIEERIQMEITVDCYDSHEGAMGWHSYLEDILEFPFKAVVTNTHSMSSFKVGETVNVIGMADADDCLHDMYVNIDDGAN